MSTQLVWKGCDELNATHASQTELREQFVPRGLQRFPPRITGHALSIAGGGDRACGSARGSTKLLGFRNVPICPQMDLEIQIGPTGKNLLPLTVV